MQKLPHAVHKEISTYLILAEVKMMNLTCTLLRKIEFPFLAELEKYLTQHKINAKMFLALVAKYKIVISGAFIYQILTNGNNPDVSVNLYIPFQHNTDTIAVIEDTITDCIKYDDWLYEKSHRQWNLVIIWSTNILSNQGWDINLQFIAAKDSPTPINRLINDTDNYLRCKFTTELRVYDWRAIMTRHARN